MTGFATVYRAYADRDIERAKQAMDVILKLAGDTAQTDAERSAVKDMAAKISDHFNMEN